MPYCLQITSDQLSHPGKIALIKEVVQNINSETKYSFTVKNNVFELTPELDTIDLLHSNHAQIRNILDNDCKQMNQFGETCHDLHVGRDCKENRCGDTLCLSCNSCDNCK